MKLAVGMVTISGAIINGENHSGHMCLGPRCLSFCPVIPFHHDDRNGIGFCGVPAKIYWSD
jgi:hypothetical protein